MATKTVSILPAGTNSHTETAENVGAVATDFISNGIVGTITSTSGVAPTTGGFAVNAQGTPDMTVAVTQGIAWVTGTPTAGNSQTFRLKMTASENVTISANSTGGTRYDYIYLKLDATKLANPNLAADDVFTLVVSRSTSNTTDDGTPPTYGYLIAKVTVANGASSIANANIADTRSRASVNAVANDGWTPVSDSWSYASATTITVPSNATAKYSIGDKLKLTQSGSVAYFYITGVASTVLTINGGTDYTLTNNPISSIYYSKNENPLNFPSYFNYTPTWTNLTIGNGTNASRFSMSGKRVNYRLVFILGSTSSVGTGPRVTLPIAASSTYSDGHEMISGMILDQGSAYIPGGVIWASSTTADLYARNSTASYVYLTACTASIPMVWTTTDSIKMSGTYEAA